MSNNKPPKGKYCCISKTKGCPHISGFGISPPWEYTCGKYNADLKDIGYLKAIKCPACLKRGIK